MINSSQFALEKAVRSFVVLGLVGAGEIGQDLKVAFDLFQYQNASTIILVIFAIVVGLEHLTDRLRAKVQQDSGSGLVAGRSEPAAHRASAVAVQAHVSR